MVPRNLKSLCLSPCLSFVSIPHIPLPLYLPIFERSKVARNIEILCLLVSNQWYGRLGTIKYQLIIITPENKDPLQLFLVHYCIRESFAISQPFCSIKLDMYPTPSAPVEGLPQPPYAPSSVPFQPGGGAGSRRWSTGLCNCCNEPSNCFITCCCPCITFGQIAAIVNRGVLPCAASGALYLLLSFTGFACLYSCCYRSRLRAQYDLEEHPCADCLVHCCCEVCALCQEYRELKNRGFDMGIGWQANMERGSHGVGCTPPSKVGGMMR